MVDIILIHAETHQLFYTRYVSILMCTTFPSSLMGLSLFSVPQLPGHPITHPGPPRCLKCEHILGMMPPTFTSDERVTPKPSLSSCHLLNNISHLTGTQHLPTISIESMEQWLTSPSLGPLLSNRGWQIALLQVHMLRLVSVSCQGMFYHKPTFNLKPTSRNLAQQVHIDYEKAYPPRHLIHVSTLGHLQIRVGPQCPRDALKQCSTSRKLYVHI